jgi:hypothetical protein
MATSEESFELTVLLSEMAHNLTHEQVRLDADYAARLQAFLPVLQAAHATSYESLARALAPMLLVVARAELRAEVQLARTEEQQFALSVRPINIGFTRKYQHSRFVRHTLELIVTRVPCPPGQPSS